MYLATCDQALISFESSASVPPTTWSFSPPYYRMATPVYLPHVDDYRGSLNAALPDFHLYRDLLQIPNARELHASNIPALPRAIPIGPRFRERRIRNSNEFSVPNRLNTRCKAFLVNGERRAYGSPLFRIGNGV